MSHNANRGDVVSSFRTEAANEAIPSSPGPPSSPPSTPTKPIVCPHEGVIAASDDEGEDDSDSDDSLEDLSTILGTRRPALAEAGRKPAARDRMNTTETPRAKRTAFTLPSSPLTLNPKVHKFDIKALAKAAQVDDAISASSERAKAALESMERQDAAAAHRSRKDTGFGSSDEDGDDQALVGVVTDNAGDDAHKVLRAVRRTEHGGAHTRYCFFETTHTSPESTAPPKIRGPWKILTQGDVPEREQTIASGLPHTLLEATGEIPTAVFEWMLDEICVQSSSLLRMEYCNLLSQSPHPQIEKLLTLERLDELLFRLGASKELQVKDAPLRLIKESNDPYAERDWDCLSSFIVLMSSVGPSLGRGVAAYAAQVFLRLSMDPLILQCPGLLVEYQKAIICLLNAIHSSDWDSFCFETTTVLHKLIRASTTWINMILCLPLHDALAHDLRRRLAIAFLLDEPTLSRGSPARAITMRDLINRLHGPDFVIHPKTDFLNLQSNVLLLDAAIDDGTFSSKIADDDEVTRLSPEAEKAFDEEVDELSDCLRAIWRKINDAGLKLARTEAKGVIEWVQQRLTHLVRTRKKVRQSVFDLDPRTGAARSRAEKDIFLPKQQDYMKRFLQKSSAFKHTDRASEG